MKFYYYFSLLIFSIFALNIQAMEDLNEIEKSFFIPSLANLSTKELAKQLIESDVNKTKNIIKNLNNDIKNQLANIIISNDQSVENFFRKKLDINIAKSKFSPDGKFLIAVSPTKNLKIWDVSNPSDIRQIYDDNLPFNITKIKFNPNSRCVVLKNHNNIIFYLNLINFKVSNQFKKVRKIYFDLSGKNVLLISKKSSILIIDFPNKTKKIRLNPNFNNKSKITAAKMSPNGKFAVTCYENKKIIFWNLSETNNPKKMELTPTNHPIKNISISYDGELLLTFSDYETKLYGISSNITPIKCINLDLKNIKVIKFIPYSCNKAIVGFKNGEISLLDFSNQNSIKSTILRKSPNSARKNLITISMAKNGNHALASFQDSSAIRFDISDLNNIKSSILKEKAEDKFFHWNSTAISPCGNYITKNRQNTYAGYLCNLNIEFEQALFMAKLNFYQKNNRNCHSLLMDNFFNKIYNSFSHEQIAKINEIIRDSTYYI